MAYKSDSVKLPRGGRRCVAGGPNLVSCSNSQHTENISMHLFPKQETDPKRRRKWINFVHKHRPEFAATPTSVLCSPHFEDSCFNVNLAVAKSFSMRRFLKDDAVPTIDVAGIVTAVEEQLTDRERRQVIRRSKRLSPLKLLPSEAKVAKLVDEEIPTTSQTADDSIEDTISYDSDMEFEMDLIDASTASHSSCTSCADMKTKLRALQKTISWYKKTKAALQMKVDQLEAKHMTSSAPTRRRPKIVELDKESSDEDSEAEGDFVVDDNESSVDYSSLEESSQCGSSAEMGELDTSRNNVSLDNYMFLCIQSDSYYMSSM